MGSTRFAGKVLAELAGKPVLQWVVEAVQKIVLIDHVVVATTDREEDAEIQGWCESFGVECFRGASEDVLKRYFDCATQLEATHILRITADCPLLDSETSETVLQMGLEAKAHYFFLSGEFPDGLDTEGFTMEALSVAHHNAVLKSEREHVTSYFRNQPQGFQILPVALFQNLGHVRITLDYPEDLSALSGLVREMQNQDLRINPEEISKILTKRPHLLAENRHIERNDGYARSLLAD